MFRIICVTLTLCAALNSANSQSLGGFDSTINGVVNPLSGSDEELQAKYQAQQDALMAQHDKFRDDITAKWSDTTAVESGKKLWVEYNDNLNSRSIVDFESGEVEVEVLLPSDASEATIEQKLEEAMARALTSRGRSSEYESQFGAPISSLPILGQQIDLGSCGIDLSILFPDKSSKPQPPPMPTVGQGATLAKREKRGAKKGEQTMAAKQAELIVEQPQVVAKTIVESVKYERREVVDKEGDKMVAAKLKLKLVDDHLSQRASQYRDIVAKHSKKFSVDEPIIYAIMEQESAFNPMAQSWVPAYGLMQLVPRSGGRDAYNYVFKEDKAPSSSYLFDPDNNVELGTAYVKILTTREFAKVKDPQCKLLCVIAAYNCGGGNVSRAINGTTNLSRAIPKINEMSYDELYSHLRQYLPDETKHYIYKVTNNVKKYSN